ncbi:phage portal protein BeeE [Haloactinospora alba]|uniref:Phage portal protein BeeE n=1 Tax=Haloactinospora alba TaxID=405555 RepID=A0A543NFL4_9ACTN|nr:phage portal protein [Haloactinospora alba]TQN30606.1 phage portal protein BeeE [Haloactinospora alba]
MARWWQRLLGRGGEPEHTEQRGTTQDWVDAVLAAQEAGVLQTTMGTLDEEQVGSTLSGLVKSNGPVWALTLARMQVFSQARFQWTRFERGGTGDLFGSPELGVLERPWPGGTTADLLARMELDVTSAGNAYVRRLRRGRTSRLVRLRPDWVTIILGSNEDPDHPADAADVELLGYAYMPRGDRGDRMIFLEPDEVAHYAPYPDPDAVFIGMSWITPVIKDVIGDNLQTDHKRAFLRNAATPNSVIKFDSSISMEQVKEFKELFEAEHQGAANAYKTLFLGGGADMTPVGKDFQQLEFAVTQGKAESRVASAAGVPPSWVGFSEGLQGSALNAGNFTSARRRFSDGTLQHLWSNAATSLETILTPPDDRAALWFATRGMPFLAMDAQDQASVQQQEANTIVALVKDGFTHESAVDAVINQDWTRLAPHTDEQGRPLMSVQLQPPMSSDQNDDGSGGDPDNGDGEPGPAPAGGGT